LISRLPEQLLLVVALDPLGNMQVDVGRPPPSEAFGAPPGETVAVVPLDEGEARRAGQPHLVGPNVD